MDTAPEVRVIDILDKCLKQLGLIGRKSQSASPGPSSLSSNSRSRSSEAHLPVHALALALQVAPPTAPEAVQLSSSVIRKVIPMERRRGSPYVSTVRCQKTEMLPLHRVQKTKGEEAEEADNSPGPRCGGFHTLFK